MMNTRKIAAEYRLSHWAQIMREKSQSGLSAKDFCQKIGISENTYFYWQKRLREAACRELTTVKPQETVELITNRPIIPKTDEPIIPKTKEPLAPSGWAVCTAIETTAEKDKALAIEIKGCRVLAEADTDSGLLMKVCRMLVSL